MAIYYGTGRNADELAAQQRGYLGGFGGGGYTGFQAGTHDAYGNPLNASTMGGVSPVGQIEPLHDYSKTALTRLGSGQSNDYTGGYMDAFKRAMGSTGDAGQYNTMASQMLQRGAGPMSEGDFASGISKYMNPYQQQVIDSSVGQVQDAATQRRSQIMDRQAGRRSFGDTSMGNQLGEIDRGMLKDIGSLTSGLKYQGYNDAVGNMNNEAGRSLQGAGLAGQLGGQSFTNLGQLMGFAQGGNNMQRQTTMDQLGAGQTIQNQNQNLLDVMRPEIYGQTNYGQTNLTNLAQLLNQFPGSSTGAQAGTPNTLSTLGGLGMFGAGIYDQYGGGGNNYATAAPISNGFGYSGYGR